MPLKLAEHVQPNFSPIHKPDFQSSSSICLPKLPTPVTSARPSSDVRGVGTGADRRRVRAAAWSAAGGSGRSGIALCDATVHAVTLLLAGGGHHLCLVVRPHVQQLRAVTGDGENGLQRVRPSASPS